MSHSRTSEGQVESSCGAGQRGSYEPARGPAPSRRVSRRDGSERVGPGSRGPGAGADNAGYLAYRRSLRHSLLFSAGRLRSI